MKKHLAPLILLHGCSLAFTSKPAASPQASCVDSYLPPVADSLGILGSLLVGTGTLVGLAASDRPTGVVPALGVAVAGTVLYTVSAVHGYHNVAACIDAEHATVPPPPPPPERLPDVPLVEAAQPRDPHAAQLTRQAHDAALRHQCAAVRAMDGRVRELDAEYHTRVFVVDPPIAACLE